MYKTQYVQLSRVYQAPLGFYNAIIPTKQFTQSGNFDAFYRVISVSNIRSTGGDSPIFRDPLNDTHLIPATARHS